MIHQPQEGAIGFASSRPNPSEVITVVSGLPRSGTSLMMQMLRAGGMSLLTDGLREPDEDNPKGYHEYSRVKGLASGDCAWLVEARGKAVKVISSLLKHLPTAGYVYKVIFMHRDLDEVLASQRRMLVRLGGQGCEVTDRELRTLFEGELRNARAWLVAHPEVPLLDVDYNSLIANPQPYAEQLASFLGRCLDVKRMTEAVDPTLYRNRRGMSERREPALYRDEPMSQAWPRRDEEMGETVEDEKRAVEERLRALGYID